LLDRQTQLSTCKQNIADVLWHRPLPWQAAQSQHSAHHGQGQLISTDVKLVQDQVIPQASLDWMQLILDTTLADHKKTVSISKMSNSFV